MRYKVDSYDVVQYEDIRFVDYVMKIKNVGKYTLCYSPKYRADVLILKKDLHKEVIR